MLLRSELARLRIDEINDERAQQFAAENGRLSASGINRGLRTLRRSMNLAYQWGKLERPARVTLAAGEKQRDRVLDEKEIEASEYRLDKCWCREGESNPQGPKPGGF
jgi:hypothetical protein